MDSQSGNWRPMAAAYGEGAACAAREAAVLVAALLADLTRFHRSGSVYGAVDPAHVLVAGGGRARLADAGQDAAPPSYQAPELHAGQPATPRSDLFSAGVVLYRLLTGVNPFEGPANLVKQRVTNMMPPRPSDVQAGVPRAYDGVVEKALAKKPDDRYASAEAFAEALMQALVPAGGAGDDETLAATVVRRPSNADATVMRGPSPDATVMRNADPSATAVRAPTTAPPAAPTRPAPAPASGGGKGMVVGGAIALLVTAAAVAYFFVK